MEESVKPCQAITIIVQHSLFYTLLSILSGAKIIGNVKIGNNVMVGAGAVVVDDIPDNAVVAGVPAKVLSYNGEFNTKLYLQ